MRYKSSGFVGLGAALMLNMAACNADELTKINSDPNNPTSAPPTAVFTNAVRIAMQRWFGTGFGPNLNGPELIIHHVANIQYTDADRYARLSAPAVEATFTNAYFEELKNLQAVIDAGKNELPERPLFWGPAQIMRSLIFGYLTDVWGDVPYSEALSGDRADGTILPAYDPQKDIYTGLLNDLTGAVAAINAGAGTTGLGASDPIYSGVRVKWMRFGNSLRARHAMRLANVDPTAARAQLNAAIGAPSGLMQSNADNAQMTWPGDDVYNNPWAVNNTERDDHRMSVTLMNQMIPVNDPRVPVYAQPTVANPGVYAGMPNALSSAESQTYTNTASRMGRVFYYTTTGCPGCSPLTGRSWPSFIMTYAEVSFILAEAAERGWIVGSAAALYEQGIRASMAQWGVTDAAAITLYLAQPSIVYQGGVAGQRQIALQKWIALFTTGIEAWANWRRTCVPETIKPGSAAVLATVPRRYQYPPREHSVNAGNVDAAVARQGADEMTTRMYWDTGFAAAPTYPGASCGVR